MNWQIAEREVVSCQRELTGSDPGTSVQYTGAYHCSPLESARVLNGPGRPEGPRSPAPTTEDWTGLLVAARPGVKLSKTPVLALPCSLP